MAKKEAVKPSFEESMARLEHIVTTLEQGNASLEESIALYEEGAQLAKDLNDTLAKAEVRIQQITKNANGKIESSDYK
jgi:exodeoxyribonuclease VII small subunit